MNYYRNDNTISFISDYLARKEPNMTTKIRAGMNVVPQCCQLQ